MGTVFISYPTNAINVALLASHSCTVRYFGEQINEESELEILKAKPVNPSRQS
jgi:hypothetical protein